VENEPMSKPKTKKPAPYKNASKNLERHEPPPHAHRAANRWRADYPIPETSNGRVLIDPRVTAKRLGCHPVTLYRWMKTLPNFPIAIRISPNRIAFYEDEVAAYIDSRPRVTEVPSAKERRRAA
jgi:predicted DNA-binding transcriptional regulator AlpA